MSGAEVRRRDRPPVSENKRLAFALLISLWVHALLMTLTFSGEGLGLPGLGLPWQDRRIEAQGMVVRLVPPPTPPVEPALPLVPPPAPQAPTEQTPSSQPDPASSLPPEPIALPVIPSAPRPADTQPAAEAQPRQAEPAGAETARALPRASGAAEVALAEHIEPPVTALKPENEVALPPAAEVPRPGAVSGPIRSSAEPGSLAPRDAGEVLPERPATKPPAQTMGRQVQAFSAYRRKGRKQGDP